MKFNLVFLFSILIWCQSFAQQYTLASDLDASVSETSGLLFLNNTLITHNDSGNTAQLFELDTATGAITRTITVTNATNIDWEDITSDDTYIYIGDFGNNEGDRTNLRIYRILISAYLNDDSVTAEIIDFSYNDQTDFTSNLFNTNFDAEGLIHYNNQLYIFTKNWENAQTHIYQLPKTPGTHSALRVDSFNSQGLVTGATYNTLDNNIMLCGYDGDGSFLIQLSDFSGSLFSNGATNKIAIGVPSGYSSQTEGIIAISATEYFVSTEQLSSNLQGLFTFNINTLSTAKAHQDLINFYPNPAQKTITLNRENCLTRIYSGSGKLVLTTSENIIDVSNFASGIYIIDIQDKGSNKSTKKQLIID